MHQLDLPNIRTHPKWKVGLSMIIIFLMCTMFAIMIQKGVLKSIYKSPNCKNVYFSPHTSVALGVSGIYCDQFTIKKYWDNSPSSHWNTSLYLLHQMPNLSSVYDFTISENITLSTNKFYKWSFHLHEGSSYMIKTCKMNGTSNVQACIIRGDKNLNDWIRTHSCEDPHSIQLCNSSRAENNPEVIQETNAYHFVYSFQNEMETVLQLQVDMIFTDLEYSIQQNNIFHECKISVDNYKNPSCTIDIPKHFRGAAVVATSGPIDQPDIWKDTLPVSWECDPSTGSFEIYIFLPLAVSLCLYFLWVLSLLCIIRYCGADKIQRVKKLVPPLIIATIVLMAAGLAINIWWIQNIAAAFSWSCQPVHVQLLFMLCIPVHGLMGIFTILYSRSMLQQQPEDQDIQEEHEEGKRKLRTKKAIITTYLVIFLTMVVVPSIAGFFTFIEAILPVFVMYPVEVDILTPGDAKILAFKKFFVSSVSIDYIGSPHLSATLYISDEQPQIEDTTYDISETILCNQTECQHIWQSHLNEQSSANITVCLNESNGTGANATFFIIKGMESYTYDKSQIYARPGKHQLNSSSLNDSNKCFEWILHIDDLNVDRYFFILEVYNYSIVDINLQFNRTNYLPKYSNTSKIDSCTISSHTIEACTSRVQNKVLSGSSTALIIITSDLKKSLFEWQETITLTIHYNIRADTWTILWLPVFVVNYIAFFVFFLFWIKLHEKLGAKSKADPRNIAQNEERVSMDDQGPNEQTPLLPSGISSRNTFGSEHNTCANKDVDSLTVTNVPTITETSLSLVIPTDINPDTTADTDNEHSNNNVSNPPSDIPVETLHSPAIEINCTDAEQKDAHENVTTLTAAMQTNEVLDEPRTHSDEGESRPVEQK